MSEDVWMVPEGLIHHCQILTPRFPSVPTSSLTFFGFLYIDAQVLNTGAWEDQDSHMSTEIPSVSWCDGSAVKAIAAKSGDPSVFTVLVQSPGLTWWKEKTQLSQMVF